MQRARIATRTSSSSSSDRKHCSKGTAPLGVAASCCPPACKQNACHGHVTPSCGVLLLRLQRHGLQVALHLLQAGSRHRLLLQLHVAA